MSDQENQKLVVMFDAPGASRESYVQLIEALVADGLGNPPGRLSHTCCAKGDGWLVVDVWESAELLNQFAQTTAPTFQRLGMALAVPQIYPLLGMIKG